MRRDYELEVDGLRVRAAYDDTCVEGVLVPILQRWTSLRDERGGRVVAFLSAPPGTGKTTLAHMLERLSHERTDVADVQVVAVNDLAFSRARLEAALDDAAAAGEPMSLLVRQADSYRSLAIDYRGGLRYPQLRRIAGQPDLLTPILRPQR